MAIWFPASVRECLARNQHRQARARVPEVAILATAKRLRPPSTGEGFDRVRVARMTADGSFQVHDSAAGAQTWPAGRRVRQPGLW